MRAVTERRRFRAFAGAERYLLFLGDDERQGLAARALVRAVAKRRCLRFPAGAPVVGAGLKVHDDRFLFAHVIFLLFSIRMSKIDVTSRYEYFLSIFENQILPKTERNFLAKTPSSQKKAKRFVILKPRLKGFLAFLRLCERRLSPLTFWFRFDKIPVWS
jgi:hypothetical protein